jgi:hypothetical protein
MLDFNDGFIEVDGTTLCSGVGERLTLGWILGVEAGCIDLDG